MGTPETAKNTLLLWDCCGDYIRRPPIAQHRVTRIGNGQVEYLAKDTKNKQFVAKRYTNEGFVNILMQHVPDRGRHAMRYFGLLSPRSKARLWAAIFVLLNQHQRAQPEVSPNSARPVWINALASGVHRCFHGIYPSPGRFVQWNMQLRQVFVAASLGE